MQPARLQPTHAALWHSPVTFRTRSDVLPRESESLTQAAQDINENPRYAFEDRPDATEETPPYKTTGPQHAASTTSRRSRLKRTVKARKLANAVPSKTTVPKKEQHDESPTVVSYAQSPRSLPWLLEQDGEELNPLLPSRFSNNLIKLNMHIGQLP